MKEAAIWLVCGLICVGIGAINIYLGVLALPIMLGIGKSFTE